MRIALLLTATIVGALFANPSHAGSLDVASAEAAQALPPGFQSYRGYMFDVSENSDRKDVDKLTDNLKSRSTSSKAPGSRRACCASSVPFRSSRASSPASTKAPRPRATAGSRRTSSAPRPGR